MIEMADLGIAVANAHPGLKRVARYNYGHHDAHVVAEVVEHLKNMII
jgi:hydroxymethylpyrimidine pyrophosphatase-like HAD family hydrolase